MTVFSRISQIIIAMEHKNKKMSCRFYKWSLWEIINMQIKRSKEMGILVRIKIKRIVLKVWKEIIIINHK